MVIRLMGTEFFHVDRQTNMTKLIVAFRNFPKAPKTCSRFLYIFTIHISQETVDMCACVWQCRRRHAIYILTWQGAIMHAKDMNVSGQFWYLTTDTSRVTDVRFPPHPTLFCGPHSRLSNAYLELFPIDTLNSFQ